MNGLEALDAFHGNRFDQFNMIIEAVVAGMGFALLPLYLIEGELKSGSLAIVMDRPITTDNSYYVVTPEDMKGSSLATDFQNWLLSQVQTGQGAGPSPRS